MSDAFFRALERLRWTTNPDAEKRRKVAAKIEAQIRADEREACAQITEMTSQESSCQIAAARIRARGEKP